MRSLLEGVRPRNGWRYRFPGTDALISASSREGLMEATRSYMKLRRLPIPDNLANQVEEWLCAEMSPMDAAQSCRWPAKPDGKTTVTAKDVSRFLDVLTEWISTSREFVSDHEALQRAAICAQCPHNVPIVGPGCLPCHGLVSRVLSAVSGRATPLDYRLQGCAVCHCSNKAQIHVPLPILQKGLTAEMASHFPSWCWKGAQPPEERER